MDNKIKTYASYVIKSEEEWLEDSTPLEQGEFGFTITPEGQIKIKVGDGNSSYNELVNTNFVTEEDIIPLATKEDIIPLATKEDIIPLATKTEIANFITEPYIVQKLTNDNKLLPPHFGTAADEGKTVIVMQQGNKWIADYLPISTIYVNNTAPTADIGEEGDLYLQQDPIY